MARRTAPRKAVADQGAPGGAVVDSDPDIGLDGSEGLDLDPFGTIFDDYSPDSEIVDLHRTAPDEWAGERIKGYLCTLVPRDDRNYLAWIKAQFGGGTFRIIRRDRASGRIVQTQTIEVSGNPVLSSALKLDHSASRSAVPGVVNIEGADVDLNGPMADVVRFLAMLRGVKEFMAPPVTAQASGFSLEDVIALVGLAKGGGDPIDYLSKLRSALPEAFDKGDRAGDGNLYGMITEAIRQAGNGITALAGVPGRSRVPAGPGLGAPLVNTRALPVGAPDNGNQKGMEDQKPMGQREMALAAAQQIVACFFDEPRPDAAGVTQQIDLILGSVSADLRRNILPFKEALGGIARGMLGQFVPEGAAFDITDFNLFYSEVFDLWCDPSREVRSL